ncbi:nitrate reductase molybdenum cofactor assembly chaperone [Microbacterium rhizosphaerae]|uniref:Nitrate reductase molybdenum cofactor assembly chaperone n=1 Tax=Microbacterium rhizosphaerae TaxID=1678237 RepID=A0ABZ0SJU5_9MICO|nr:nitrate reductase molybdenum cofactor assembly chaperone [Microbacterium rhizosphaerae]WPR89666.1 nitrate reductase molybdenum cofactor assembly chaperone [Microbacterium rhizosphaerae]
MIGRVTPQRMMPDPLPSLSLRREQRATAHMVASLLLDYPDDAWFSRLPVLRAHVATLPHRMAQLFDGFMDAAAATGPRAWQAQYVATFDLKRRCSLYLTYYATGDTRRRGAALVAFLDAYRAAGWEFEADELPDYLPAVLELSASSDSPIAAGILSAHREGVEVLRYALESQDSPWSAVVRAVTLSLPPIDERTRERYLRLINDGPPTETVGIDTLPPFPVRPEMVREG